MRAAVLLVALLFPSAAAAQSVDVEALDREGIDLRRQRRDADALRVFERAWELTRAPRERAQVGFAEQALGRWVDADVHLREARSAGSDPWIAERRPVIDDALREIDRHLGALDVRGAVAGASVRIDGREVGTLPFARPVRTAAGTVSLEVTAPGYLPARRDVRVGAGDVAREAVTLVPAGDGAAPGDPAATHRVAAWVTGGGALVGATLGFIGLAEADPSSGTIVGLSLGGALAVTSVVLFVTLPPRRDGRARAAGFGCGPGPGDFGVACGGAL